MGCDIHMRVETLPQEQRFPSEPEWKIVEDIFDSPYSFDKGRKINSPYDGRNYDLFGILANVRNGSGFAGCDLGNGFNPISRPKGTPENCSDAGLGFMTRYGCDGHSHSYFTVQELLDYDWNQVTKSRGYVDIKGYKYFKEYSKPNMWCGDSSGSRVVKVANKEMDRLIETNSFDPEKFYYTQVEWEVKYSDAAGSFFTETIPKLKELGDPDKVRIIFFFDN